MVQGFTGADALEKSVTILMGKTAITQPAAKPVNRKIVEKKNYL